ncbi:MAG: TolC family protein [Phycisphaeraceae bacterium]|jgi:outer membrane protein, heavy metal efflux system|nr:MAG: TolC family protein [Phycisphaeraceae bacterium]
MTQIAFRPIARTMLTAACAGLLSACAGTPTTAERERRADLASVERVFRPGDARPALPELTSASTLADLLRFAMLNSPRVEAAYYQWAAGVERITTSRSLPDPRLTFEADITDMLEALMPGLMMDLPGPGKLRAAGDVAAGEAIVGYFAFEAEVLRTALAVKSAYYRMHFLEETIRVQRETLSLLADLEQIAQAQNAAGRVTLQDVLRAQIDREQLATQIDNLDDSRGVLLAELKAALGLGAGAPDPAVPSAFEPSPAPQSADAVFAAALERNPSLRGMAADVRRAEAMLDLARTSGVPDFSVGIEADLKASPVMWRPSAGVTLPIWRDKIAAEIAAAQADKRSAEARLTAEQVSLAAELASMLYMYRESSRNTDLLVDRLIPRARQSLEVARSGYTTGRSSFLDLIDAQRKLLGFELALVEARTQRELALTALSLSIEGVSPEGAPVLAPTSSTPLLNQSTPRETLP